MTIYNIFVLHETTHTGNLVWRVADRVHGKPSEQELKNYGGIKQVAVVDGYHDVQDVLEGLNESARKYNARAEAITKISWLVHDYAIHYAKFFEENFSDFEYKNDGTLYKKWADKLKGLPAPLRDEVHYFGCDQKGWLKISVYGGYDIGYVEESVCVFSPIDGGTSQPCNDGYFNSTYRPVKAIDVYTAELEIAAHEDTIKNLKGEISSLKSKMGW